MNDEQARRRQLRARVTNWRTRQIVLRAVRIRRRSHHVAAMVAFRSPLLS